MSPTLEVPRRPRHRSSSLRRDAAEMPPRCSRDAAEMQPSLQLTEAETSSRCSRRTAEMSRDRPRSGARRVARRVGPAGLPGRRHALRHRRRAAGHTLLLSLPCPTVPEPPLLSLRAARGRSTRPRRRPRHVRSSSPQAFLETVNALAPSLEPVLPSEVRGLSRGRSSGGA